MCSHLHADHIGWNTRLQDGKWIPTFPTRNISSAAMKLAYWEAAVKNNEEASFGIAAYEDSVAPVIAAGQFVIDRRQGRPGSRCSATNSRFHPLAGHTPGHTGLFVESGNNRALFDRRRVAFSDPVSASGVEHIRRSRPDMAEATRRHIIQTFTDSRHPADDRTFPGAVGGPPDLHWRSSRVSLRLVCWQLSASLSTAIGWPHTNVTAFAKREETCRAMYPRGAAGSFCARCCVCAASKRRCLRSPASESSPGTFTSISARRRPAPRSSPRLSPRPARHDAPQSRPHHRARRRSGEGAGGDFGARRRAQRRAQRHAASVRSFARLYFDIRGGRRLHLARGRRRLCLQAGRRRRGGGRVLRRRRARRGRQLRGHEYRVADAAAGAVRLREQQRRRLGCGARRFSDFGSRRRRRSVCRSRERSASSPSASTAPTATRFPRRRLRPSPDAATATARCSSRASPKDGPAAIRCGRRWSTGETDIRMATGEAPIEGEHADWYRYHDPVLRLARSLAAQGTDAVGRIHFYDAEIREDMKRAMQEALASPFPEPQTALDDVFAGSARHEQEHNNIRGRVRRSAARRTERRSARQHRRRLCAGARPRAAIDGPHPRGFPGPGDRSADLGSRHCRARHRRRDGRRASVRRSRHRRALPIWRGRRSPTKRRWPTT